MSRIFTGIALGAAGAFMLDPQQGRRRRALLRDKVVRGVREGREFGDAAAKDLRARAQGAVAQVRALGGGPVTDEVLVSRARAKLGRFVAHPHALKIVAHGGMLTLTGDVLAGEHPSLVRAILAVPGVKDVDDRLDVHTSAEGISSLQGGTAPDRERFGLLQRTWTPGVRALVGGAGALLVAYALLRGGVRGVAAIAGGAALLARASANRPLQDAIQVGREKAKQLEIAA